MSVHDDERGACAGDCEDCREQDEALSKRFIAEKIPAGTIDLTPSWESVALICMDVLQDLYVKLQKERA